MKWGNDTPLIGTLGWEEQTGLHVTKADWCGALCGFALGDGTILFAGPDGVRATVRAHDGACLAACALNGALVTCGDDGKVVATAPDGAQSIRFDKPGRFIDRLATAPWGGIAFADGRRIYALLPEGGLYEYMASGSVGGLAFSPKGRKLAASRNNGASVYLVGTERTVPEDYEWKGAHGPILWSLRGDFIVTAMHENALHVWRADHAKHGRMGGYPARIRSMSWDPKGDFLATSGADGVIVWPFAGKNGPIGQGAAQIPLKSGEIVSCLAWHPASDIIAVGTEAGNVALVRHDGATIAIAALQGPVTTLAWAARGHALAFGSDRGTLGIVDCTALREE